MKILALRKMVGTMDYAKDKSTHTRKDGADRPLRVPSLALRIPLDYGASHEMKGEQSTFEHCREDPEQNVNQMVADAIGQLASSGPTEARMFRQSAHAGSGAGVKLGGIDDVREVVRNSVEVEEYSPTGHRNGTTHTDA